MADITKCSGVFNNERKCPIREECYRFTSPNNTAWQSYMLPPGQWVKTTEEKSKWKFECNNFWNIKK
jgi:hypothetical protein